jgi:hypothetical protein
VIIQINPGRLPALAIPPEDQPPLLVDADRMEYDCATGFAPALTGRSFLAPFITGANAENDLANTLGVASGEQSKDGNRVVVGDKNDVVRKPAKHEMADSFVA